MPKNLPTHSLFETVPSSFLAVQSAAFMLHKFTQQQKHPKTWQRGAVVPWSAEPLQCWALSSSPFAGLGQPVRHWFCNPMYSRSQVTMLQAANTLLWLLNNEDHKKWSFTKSWPDRSSRAISELVTISHPWKHDIIIIFSFWLRADRLWLRTN